MSRPKRQTDGDGRLVESLRNERLELLRKQVAEGTYQVSDRTVAAAMVRRGFGTVIDRSRSQG
jgi:anti-sigma28 factor (negative regulator of flagellin synthesis)